MEEEYQNGYSVYLEIEFQQSMHSKFCMVCSIKIKMFNDERDVSWCESSPLYVR